MAEYPVLDEVIQEFPYLRFLSPGRCAKCGVANSENGSVFITRHHIFPNRHWPDNIYMALLCMSNGKKNENNGEHRCHDLIEREIKMAEQGRRLEPRQYCVLTAIFLGKIISEEKPPTQASIKKQETIRRPLNGFFKRGISY